MTSPSSPPPSSPSSTRQIPVTFMLAGAGLIAVALIALIIGFGGSAADGPSSGVDDEFLELGFTTESGDVSRLSDYVGEPLVVNFFAAWCAPCRRELPDFEQVATANIESVKILGVSHDLDETTWRNLVAETGVTFETVFQPGSEIHTAVGAQGMPTTIFISEDGELLDSHTGLMSAEALQKAIDVLFTDTEGT